MYAMMAASAARLLDAFDATIFQVDGEYAFACHPKRPGKASRSWRRRTHLVSDHHFTPILKLEVFHVLAGRYLYEVDGRRFYSESADVITVPGGMAHAFVNVTDAPARQFILIMPGLDVVAFFKGLRDLTKDGKIDVAALNVYGEK